MIIIIYVTYYFVIQYHWTNRSLIFISEVELDSEINNIIWSEDSEYVYLTTTDEVCTLYMICSLTL